MQQVMSDDHDTGPPQDEEQHQEGPQPAQAQAQAQGMFTSPSPHSLQPSTSPSSLAAGFAPRSPPVLQPIRPDRLKPLERPSASMGSPVDRGECKV